MYNLTRYKIYDRVIVGKTMDNPGQRKGYPWQEAVIIEKAPKMVKVQTQDGSYWGKPQQLWLLAEDWFVVTKIKRKGGLNGRDKNLSHRRQVSYSV